MKKKLNWGNLAQKPGSFKKIQLIMKLTLLLTTVISFQVSASVFSQQIKLDQNTKGETVRNVLKIIEKETNIRFFYNDDFKQLNKVVTQNINSSSLDEMLGKICKTADLSYKIIDNNFVVVYPTEMSQGIKITGKITDASTGEPLPGVNIQIEGTTQGTTTDPNGNYTIDVPSADIVLVFSYVGYNAERYTVGQQTTINIKLVPEIKSLEQVVVVGYGVQKKSVVTGAISTVNSEDIENTSISKVQQALQGRTAGVQVIQNSGAPGAGIHVRIRGYSSNQSSEPIYIVNGYKMMNIDDINPNDIKSIEVLKDAASAAIYGSEGANGVVLITTKSGSSGKGHVTYEFQYGIQQLAKKVDVLNAAEFSQYMTEAGLLSNPISQYNTDWQDAIFEKAPSVKHYFSFTGGNDKGSFLLSLSSLNQDGVVKGNKDQFKRYTIMFNSNYKIIDWLKVGHNLSFAHTDLNSVSENSEYGSVISDALMMDPLTPVSYTNGVPASVQALLDAGHKPLKDENGNYYGISEYLNGEIGNPFVARDRSLGGTKTNILFGNVYADFMPVKGLVITSRLGGTINSSDNHVYNPVYYYNASQFNDIANTAETVYLTTRWQWENFANYTRSFGNHNMTLLLGMSSEETNVRYLNGSGGPLTQDNSLYDDLSYLQTNPNDNVAGYSTIRRLLSYFGRVNYDYNNKYLFQASLRRDGAGEDVLSPDNRWGTFPAVSVGWVLTNESFFPSSFVSFLKVRGSWGQNGSISNLNNYLWASLLQSTGSYPVKEDLSITATQPANLANNKLKWETSEQTDVGIDLRAFKDRLTFSVDYYIKTTKDLLTQFTPPLETGLFTNQTYVNAGDVQNKGFEFELGYRNNIGDFSYNVNGNLATLHNEVTYLNPDLNQLNGAQVNLATVTVFKKGEPIWYFYGYKTDGIDPTTGDPVFVDEDGVPGITTADKTYIGSGIPKITYGGNLTLSYKGFDIEAFVQGQAGNKILFGMVRTDRPVSNKLKVFYDDRWTPTHTEATMPKAGTISDSWHSDLLVFSGNYMKVKQLQLGYTLPKSLLNKVKATKARFYVSLENGITFTKYPGMDPEVGSQFSNSIGVDRGMFPISKNLLFGATVTF
jgi:TonB-dependent starch-binding outer membrane protein SusC